MKWCKLMSTTDAQQPTSGRVVPYLRFIKGDNPQNNQTWFRNTFFGSEVWSNSSFGQHTVERCDVTIDVTIDGSHKGARQFFVTHDDTRMENNSTPNTWLHYDPATLTDFQNVNTEGMTFCIEKTKTGYKLEIS